MLLYRHTKDNNDKQKGKMKIINMAANDEVVANITGGNNLTLDEAIELVGEFVQAEDAPNVIIDDEGYYYDDLAYVTDDYDGEDW